MLYKELKEKGNYLKADQKHSRREKEFYTEANSFRECTIPSDHLEEKDFLHLDLFEWFKTFRNPFSLRPLYYPALKDSDSLWPKCKYK